ncbi:hypothetical protein K3495_g7519 [Podosphaera aphanis]|nr:hypothetical protein K3495_g7519 [Podosphaera aphanis]
MNSYGRDYNFSLAQDYEKCQSFLVGTEKDLHSGKRNGTTIITLSYALKISLIHIVEIITKVEKNRFLMADFQEDLIEHLRVLIQDIKGNQITLLEASYFISKFKTSNHEELNSDHGESSQKFTNYNLGAKNFNYHPKNDDQNYQVLND